MSVLFVELTDGSGGSSRSLLQLLQHLPQTGFTISVALPEHNRLMKEFHKLGVRTHPLPGTAPGPGPAAAAREPRGLRNSGWYRALSARRRFASQVTEPGTQLAEALRSAAPGLVYANNGLVIGARAVAAAGTLRVPVLCHERGLQSVHSPYRRLGRTVRRFVCISHAVRAHVTRAGFGPRSEVVHNGIDLAAFHPGIAPDPELQGTGPLLVSTGRLTRWKGVHVLLDAAARLLPRHPDLRVAIAGTGEEEPALRRQAVSLGLADRVLFLGFVEDPRPVVRAATVLVHAAVEPEPFGRTVLEGLALGVPVVGTRLGAVPEILVDGESGVMTSAGDADALARTLGSLLEDDDLRSRLARQGRARAESAFDQRTGSARIAAIIQDALSGGAP